MANIISLLILIVFFYGRSLYRRNTTIHIGLMLACLVADYLLVLMLVLFRDALASVSPGMHWTLFVHIPFALSSVVLYALTAFTGYQLWQGKPVRARMKLFDRLLVLARVLTLITSFMVQFFR